MDLTMQAVMSLEQKGFLKFSFLSLKLLLW
jgi:hypothetical protein